MSDPRPSRKRLRRRAAAAVARATVPGLLRLFARTWRVRRVHEELREEAKRDGAQPVYAIWHRHIPPALGTHARQPFRVMISQHRDGETIARVAGRLGMATVRGSTTRGSQRAVRDMLRAAEQPEALVFTPDGPRGPAESVAPGVAWLAGAVQRPILPAGFAASRAWFAASWDRMMLPKPFARVVVHYGPLVAPPPDPHDDAAVDAVRDRLQQALRAAQRAAEEEVAAWTGAAAAGRGNEAGAQEERA